MRQIVHLFIVDSARGAALAARVGTRWLLPVFGCGERVRVPLLAARWCAEQGIRGDAAGQWLGRVSEHATDWLMVVAADASSPVAGSGLAWTAVDALATGPAVLDYQQWAVARTLASGPAPAVTGPFGNLDWPARARTWIAKATGSAPAAVTPYRVSAHEVVLGADCTRGRVYFKGLAGQRAAEARLTQALAALAPASFAETLALERRADGSTWWLTAACPGEPLRDAPTAARALADLQQRAMQADPARLALPEVDLAAAARWARDLIATPGSASLIDEACAAVCGANGPRSWIPMDLDPTNMLMDDAGAVRFIDVDDSFAGPAPLAMAAAAQRWRDPAAYRAYETSWPCAVSDLAWQPFEVAAAVLQAWLGWQRIVQHVACSEVCADLDRVAARIRERLDRAIYGCR